MTNPTIDDKISTLPGKLLRIVRDGEIIDIPTLPIKSSDKSTSALGHYEERFNIVLDSQSDTIVRVFFG